jgi:hypothetical protein
MRLCIDNDRQQAVLQRVLPEDVREARRNNCLETEVHERPHGVFSRASASEIVSGNQNFRGSARDAEIRPVFEEMCTDAGLVRDLQKTRRNDLIRIDVLLRHNNRS